MESSAPIYRALADDTRLRIVTLLLEHNYCLSELACVLHVSESAVSQHLDVLKEAGLLIDKKCGYCMHYDINRKKLRMLASTIFGMAALECRVCTGFGGTDCSVVIR